MKTQRYEIEAWLGDALAEMSEEQVDQMHRMADEIRERYPDPDAGDEREAAMIAAHRILMEGDAVVDEMANDLRRARSAEIAALAGLRQAATMLIPPPSGSRTDRGITRYAQRAGVHRGSVLDWLGER